jgi:DNA polymerase-3 subunit epsilon
VSEPGAFGPISSRRRAQLAARALGGFDGDDPAVGLPPIRAKLRKLARDQRFEDAARLRDRMTALEDVVSRIAELNRLRSTRACILAPAREHGFRRAFFVAGGRIAAIRTLPAGSAGRLELEVGLAEAALVQAQPSFAPEDADELMLLAGLLKRPGPELRIVSLVVGEVLAA